MLMILDDFEENGYAKMVAPAWFWVTKVVDNDEISLNDTLILNKGLVVRNYLKFKVIRK